jgi:CubicO group peptidase (beta-lactamase class C family)
MSSGMQWSDIPNIDSNRLLSEKNWIGYIMAKPILANPEQHGTTTAGAPADLGDHGEGARVSLRDFAEERLFGPLGILD